MASPILSAVFSATPRRRTQRAVNSIVEVLEERSLLAADFNLANPSILNVTPSEEGPILVVGRYTVRNAGDEAIAADEVSIQAVLSADQIFGNSDDILVSSTTVDINLAANSESPSNVAIAPTLAQYQGSSFLLIKIDGTNLVAEANESNNIAAIALPSLPTFTPSGGQKTGKTNKTIVVDSQIKFSGLSTNTSSSGTLTISIAGQGQHDDHDHDHDHDEHEHEEPGAHDTISIKKSKTASGTLRRKNGELLIGKRVIGLIGGGLDSAPLTIRFTAAVTANEIEAIAAAVSLKGKKGDPGLRQMQFKFRESAMITGPIATKGVLLT